MRLFRPSFLAKLFFPGAIFRIETDKKEICLTFDDGPDPDSTPGIVEILLHHRVRAVFFCTGQKALDNPELMNLISSDGHLIGNHGFTHTRGWKTTAAKYIEDVTRAADITSPDLFRPPYGSLRPAQYRQLRKNFTIMFWDLMPYDFDPLYGSERSLRVLKNKTRPGSVIVLHDKAGSTVLSFLEEFLDFAGDEGFKFVIPGVVMQEKQKPPL